MNHPIGRTRNNIDVYVDLIHSEAAKRIAEQPHLLGLIAEVLPQTALSGTNLSVECDMGRAIGYDFVVSTADSDSVFYAQIAKDETYTRFVKNATPKSTQSLTLVLRLTADKKAYSLHDAWIGHLSPPRPGDTTETPQSRPYWANHAFVLGTQTLQPRSVTKDCPYLVAA